jgi:hypothetical protein
MIRRNTSAPQYRRTLRRLASGRFRAVLAAGLALALAGCAIAPSDDRPLRKEELLAVAGDGATQSLIRFNAGRPDRILARHAVAGLAPGERLVGIDFRVARGVLYGLSDRGRLYTLDPSTGAAKPLAPAAKPLPLAPGAVGFDFNPAADRIRVVGETTQNLRAHPDTGALVTESGDPNLRFAPGDRHAGTIPQVVAAGYTYNKKDEKLTTNYAIDRGLGWLVTQGTREDVTPAVSPNTGLLYSVGSLGVGSPLVDVSMDIADVSNAAYAAITTRADACPQLVEIDLATGLSRPLGRIGRCERLAGIAVEP